MRESSVMAPFRVGTLKSTLTRTVFPVTSISLTDRLLNLVACVIFSGFGAQAEPTISLAASASVVLSWSENPVGSSAEIASSVNSAT